MENHRLLRGQSPPYANRLTAREMDSLTALCDTLLPSVVKVSSGSDGESNPLSEFLGTSASMVGTPEHMGGLMSGRLRHPMLKWIRVVLWLLSTWWGTFAICGWVSLSSRFPYFHHFSAVAPERREEIILSWSLSSFFLYRMLFKSIKYITMLTFFTRINEKNENPTWKALGYCGPDPRFVDSGQTLEEEEVENKDQCLGTLHRSVVDSSLPEEDLLKAFCRAGFSASAAARSSPLTLRCDAVVVGSGSGGSVVAGVLARAGYKVVVLEKGRYFARGGLSLLEGPSFDHMYEGGGLVTTDDVSVLTISASTVGGGSTINWSASIRTPDHVRNEWCDDHELKLFGSKAFDHALDVVCDRMGVQSEVKEEGFNNAILRRGCLELGYPVSTVPRNSPPDHYCGWCYLGCKDGRKKSVLETWLADMVETGNGVILHGCTATKVLHRSVKGKNRKVAAGVIAEIHGVTGSRRRTILIESNVTIVAGGALNTPALLRRSGLKNLNIGKNLHLHPVIMAWGYFPESDDGKEGVWPEKEKKSYEGGIITSMSTAIANFDTSGYGSVIQTPVLHPGVFSVVTPWISAMDYKKRMAKFSRTATLFALVRDRGSGDAGDFPNSLTYKLSAADEESLKTGKEKMLRILAAAGAAEIGTHHCAGKVFDVRKGSKEEMEEFVKEEAGRAVRDLAAPLISAHQMGSCRMGKEEGTSAVSPTGETWEVEGLFVSDTSVFPTALGVNPMVTVQAIAYCTAQHVLETLHRKKSKKKISAVG